MKRWQVGGGEVRPGSAGSRGWESGGFAPAGEISGWQRVLAQQGGCSDTVVTLPSCDPASCPGTAWPPWDPRWSCWGRWGSPWTDPCGWTGTSCPGPAGAARHWTPAPSWALSPRPAPMPPCPWAGPQAATKGKVRAGLVCFQCVSSWQAGNRSACGALSCAEVFHRALLRQSVQCCSGTAGWKSHPFVLKISWFVLQLLLTCWAFLRDKLLSLCFREAFPWILGALVWWLESWHVSWGKTDQLKMWNFISALFDYWNQIVSFIPTI